MTHTGHTCVLTWATTASVVGILRVPEIDSADRQNRAREASSSLRGHGLLVCKHLPCDPHHCLFVGLSAIGLGCEDPFSNHTTLC